LRRAQTALCHAIHQQERVIMKAKELRELSVEELEERAKETGQELFNLRFQKATGQLGNTAMIRKTKKFGPCKNGDQGNGNFRRGQIT
jgi:large subunit ribosomal protein L29